MFGQFEESFLELPEEVIVTSIKTHQKCFSLKNAATGKLSNHFVLTSNIVPKDGGAAIIKGNERVVRARLSDAAFFWQTDLNTPLEKMSEKLSNIVFHEKLGSQAERVARLEALSGEIAGKIGADVTAAKRAAKLCKSDLVSEMVGEFPELQGLMGRYYAAKQGESMDVAEAIEMHYKPQGPSDNVPTAPVSIAVALADKLDLLTGFWAIDEKPTGSKDPFALRRAALGVIRLVLENKLRLELLNFIKLEPKQQADLLVFFHDRLKVYLRDEGVRHDVIDAVLALDVSDDLYLVASRARALSDFLKTEDGGNLLGGVKRSLNILAAEEKKDGVAYEGKPEAQWMKLNAETALFEALQKAEKTAYAALDNQDYAQALSALATLRGAVDGFFEAVVVNDDNQIIRRNRLCLLNRVRGLASQFADFGVLEGA
jgi:glycyl-tRNA synthetase beta chain